jgi:hypothetical protein
MASDLQFNEPGVNSIAARRPKIQKKTFADRLIAMGLAKDEAQANLYLIGFIVIAFGLIIYINLSTFRTPAPVNFTDDELMMMEM